jgi:hypothetical protein
MRAGIRNHIRSNVVAYVALFAALGGTGAWAADKITSKDIAKNAVRSKHIKNGQVKKRDLASGLRGPGGAMYSAIPDGGLRLNASNGFGLASCPNGQILKSSGSAYACAADDNVPGPDSVGSDQVIDGSLTSSDLGGSSWSVGTDPPPIANGACDVIAAADLPGESWDLFDFVITSDSIDLPTGAFLTGEVVGSDDVELQICNFSGGSFDPPSASYLFFVIDNG